MKFKNYFLLFSWIIFNLFDGQLLASSQNLVKKYTLENGMTVLVFPNQYSSEVAMFLWYDVGAKHEMVGERGMAHFIEHMVFKGTKTMLSESDINTLESKLTSYVNAFTWYDYTAYVFKLPTQNWEKVLPVFADCMQNVRFSQDHMDSEVKAVIQELDMRRDMHEGSLAEAMASAIFDAHPYHYSVIGFKQDLCRLKQDTLVKFYQKHYIPQNATLVLVGNLDPDVAFAKVSQHFSAIPAGNKRADTNFYFNEDVQTQVITLYRDIEQPIAALAFVIPGVQDLSPMHLNVLGRLLANDMSSRLYKKLIEQQALVSSISTDELSTFEKNIFYFVYTPKNVKDIPQIKELILQEIQDVIDHGFTSEEFARAVKLTQVARQSNLESVYYTAYEIGKTYLATGDHQATLAPFDQNLQTELVALMQRYFRRSACHEGYVFNVVDQDKQYFSDRMHDAHTMSAAMLAAKARETQVEPARYANTVFANKFVKKEFAKPEIFMLENGLEVLLYPSKSVDLVKCSLSCKADDLYDTQEMEGMSVLVAKMMLEGTKDLPGMQFVQTIGSYGISISTGPGCLSSCMLPQDIARGLNFVASILTDANFEPSSFEKIKNQHLLQIKQAQDDARFILNRKAEQIMYQDHPYGRSGIGSEQSVQAIDRDGCFEFYKKYFSPQGARLVIVGNFDPAAIKQTVQDAFLLWQGEMIPDLTYPKIQTVVSSTIDIEMNRDQVFLGFFAPSVAFVDPDYDYLKLFNILLISGGFDTYLFAVREQTGLFYNIGGSIVSGARKEPGLILIRTMVAPDRVQEAQETIVDVMTQSVDLVTDEKFEQAQEKLIREYFGYYETLSNQATTFLHLRDYDLPFDYYEKQIDKIRSMNKQDMQRVVKKYLSKDKTSCIRVGKF